MAKKRKTLQHKQRPKPGGAVQSQKSVRKDTGRNPNTNKSNKPATSESKPGSQNTHLRDLQPTIPFSPEDAILLVGEGDLSFSRALVEHHCCEHLTATVLEPNLQELAAKYPHVQDNVDKIEAEGGKVLYGVDAKKMGPWAKKLGKESIGLYDRISMSCALHEPDTKKETSRLTTGLQKSSTSHTSVARAQT